MQKNSKPVIIMAIVILLVVVGFSAISMYNYQNVPEVEISESPFGIQWGADKEIVESAMSAQGYELKTSDVENPYRLVYILRNYQGLAGANGYAIFTFDESLKFTDVLLQFSSPDYANGSCEAKTVDMLYKSFCKTLNKKYEKMPYDSLEDYEYWKGENLFSTVFYLKSEAVLILYSQNDTIAEQTDEMLNSNN